jgi:DNA-damage-inducible protein J
MANTTMVNFRMDSDLKSRMEKTCKDMGLTLSSAFTMFATKVTQEQRIPFEITADSFYSKENMEILERRAKDAKEGKNMHEHELIEVDE